MYQAYHRFLKTTARRIPNRLTSVILVSGRNVPASVAEIRRCGREPWPVGIFPICPPEMSLDDPAWEPIWAEAQAHDLAIVIHSFTMSVPYPPGMWDTWDNVFLQRSAGHVWNAQRNMAALIGAGVLDRYPDLRLTSLECGHGWLAVLGRPARRARRDVPARAAAAQAEARASTSAVRSTTRASSSTRASCRCARPSRPSARTP